MCEQRTPLFWGVNREHEFFQSADAQLLLMRVHGERFWTAHRNGMYQGVSFESEEDAARALGAVLSHNKV